MDVQGRKGSGKISTSNPSKPVGTEALRNFTIPRKKRESGQVHLEPCPDDSRDYTLIQTKLRELRLDMRKECANTWLWKDVKLVHNDGFLKEFSEKRSEMRTKGRYGTEMEERFCFLVASSEATNDIYQFGLRTGSQDQYSLGKPSHGVYVFKHVDVALKHATATTCSGKSLLVFKVLFGRVKKVTPSLEWNRTVDPMVGFDCHMAKFSTSNRESVSQQVLGSAVFLFDYSENQELNKRPRQCLPYAVVSFAPSISETPISISPPVSPSKPAGLTHGPLDHLKGCTVAKRTGKGENTTVTYKRFGTEGCSDVEYQSQTVHGVNASPVQYNNLQTPTPLIPQQPCMSYYNTSEYFTPLLPSYNNGLPWQNYMDKPECLSNIHSVNTTSVHGGNIDTLGVRSQTSSEKISTVVYSSRLVKDPRLSRQEATMQKKRTEEERASSLQLYDEHGSEAHAQTQKEANEFTLSCEKESLVVDEKHKEARFPKPSLDDSSKSNSTAQPKTETMPSSKLFKMKFHKYAPYFKMAGERQTELLPKGNLSSEQKQSKVNQIQLNEAQHQRYKRGLCSRKDTKIETKFSSSHIEPQNNDVFPSTPLHSPLRPKGDPCELNQSCMRHSVNPNVSNLTATTVLMDIERNNVAIQNTETYEVCQNICRTEEKSIQEKEQDPSSDSQIGPQNSGAVQSVKENISEMVIVEGSAQSVPPAKSQVLESILNLAQSSCPSIQVEIDTQSVQESEISTSIKESFAHKHTLTNTIEEFGHIIALEVGNCVDISATDVPECNDCSFFTRMEQIQDNHHQSIEKHDMETSTNSKPDTNSEMSIEVERGEAHQHNTIYNALYKRLQLDQLLSDSNGADLLSNKSFLWPKGLDKTLGNNLSNSNGDEPGSKEEHFQLIVEIKSSQTPKERLTLSERFSKLRHLRGKLATVVHVDILGSSCTAHLNGELKCKPEALIPCGDGGTGSGSNNAELIKLMAKRYNEKRFIANCKPREKGFIVKNRTDRTSAQVPFYFRRKTTHIRKSHLLKAKRKFKRKLGLKISSRDQASLSNLTADSSSGLSYTETVNDVDYRSVLYLNLGAGPHSQSDSQNNGKPLNMDSSQNGHASNVLPEETSCVDSEQKSRQDDEFSQIKHQYTNPAEESREMVWHDVLNNDDVKKSEEIISLDSKNQVMIEEMETSSRTNNSKKSHQETSYMVTCCGSIESCNVERPKSEHKEEAILQCKKSLEDNCNTKEISPDNNTGAYKQDTSRSVPAVSSVPCDITSGNVIIRCTAKVQEAMTSDSSQVMNNETDTQTKARIIDDSAVDNSGSDLSKRVSSTNKSEKTSINGSLHGGDLHNNTKNIDTNEKALFSKKENSADEQNFLKPLKAAKENPKHLPQPTSHSPCQPSSLQDIKSSGMNLVAGTSYFHSRVTRDAQEDLALIKDSLQSTWQERDKNSLPATSDTQIITKLRDYLTKFEVTVKKPETISNSVTEAQVPTAWITLDSTTHKQQLQNTRHYIREALADRTPKLSETVYFPVTPTNHKVSNMDSQPNSSMSSKRRRMNNMERVSPDSTITETIRPDPNSYLRNKNTQPYQTTIGVPAMNHQLQSHGNKLQENEINCPQVPGNLSRSNEQQGNRPSEQPCQVKQLNEQNTHEKVNTMNNKSKYSVTDISDALKLADHAVSLPELGPLQTTCKRMLQYFISNFEKNQQLSFYQFCISRNLILEKYLDHPPVPVELKFEAINSFLELQMIFEACQFVENKINFLKKKPTFRTLLWYDPSLYGELYKGTVGFQQQSSFFSSFQQCLCNEDYRRLREYYWAVSTLHQQLQDTPDTSYYMYLKTKRERLEIEAAFRNPSDVKTFFLSVPTSIMINLGDNLEILKKTYDIVMTFIETPADRLPGTFDVGKAEHLSIMCRYLQEKIVFMKTPKEITKVSWFGMEHLLYDASKILVWKESENGMPYEVLTKYKKLNSSIVYGMAEPGVAFGNNMNQPPQPMDVTQITPPPQMNASQIQSAAISTERTQTVPNIQIDDGSSRTPQSPRRRATPPFPRGNASDGVNPVTQPNLAPQPGSSSFYTDFNQRSNALHWTVPTNPAWDWGLQHTIQSTSHPEIRSLLLSTRAHTAHTNPRTSLPDLQNHLAVRQPQQRSQPLIVKPRPLERSKAQPTISAPQHQEQANEFNIPMMPPFSFLSFSPEATSFIPPPLPPPPFSSTSNQVALHTPTPISYPFFVFNGQTYSTTGSSVPVSGLHTETQYLPRAV